jgi:hypothetical protein
MPCFRPEVRRAIQERNSADLNKAALSRLGSMDDWTPGSTVEIARVNRNQMRQDQRSAQAARAKLKEDK